MDNSEFIIHNSQWTINRIALISRICPHVKPNLPLEPRSLATAGTQEFPPLKKAVMRRYRFYA